LTGTGTLPKFVAMTDPTLPGSVRPGDPVLSERQRDVFRALVRLHGRDARPVGSDRIASEAPLRLSGASVRAVLGELEDLGLLARPAGGGARVPSAGGFAYYVRAVLEPAALPREVHEAIDDHFRDAAHDVERLLLDASRLLASLTRQLGLALATSFESEPLTSLDLEPLGERRALLVLGLGGHAARTLVLELDTPLDRGALESVELVLRERLLGRTLGEVRRRLAQSGELAHDTFLRVVARAALASWTRPVETSLHASGAGHIARQPEFAHPGRLGPVLEAVESGEPLNRLLVSGIQGQAGVRVGLEAGPGLDACSLVSFALPGAIPGAVGVLGPLRMDYAWTLAVVDTVGTRVSDLLSA
jgi:heat-inducible transcriptional repressor